MLVRYVALAVLWCRKRYPVCHTAAPRGLLADDGALLAAAADVEPNPNTTAADSAFRSIGSAASNTSAAPSIGAESMASSKSNAPAPAPQRFGFAVCFLLDLLYLPLTTAALETFQCEAPTVEPYEGAPYGAGAATIRYLRAAPHINCDAQSYRSMVGVAALIFGAFSVAYPLALVFGVVWPHRTRLDRSPYRNELGFLWSTTRQPQYWWWGVGFGYGRKLALALVLTSFRYRSIFVPLSVFVLLSCAVLLSIHAQPYTHRTDNADVLLTGLATATSLERAGGCGAGVLHHNGLQYAAARRQPPSKPCSWSCSCGITYARRPARPP